MRYGYARVSTTDQHLERQLDALSAAGVPEANVRTDKLSGATVGRSGLQTLLSELEEGDELVVKSIDRLGRNLGDLVRLVDDLTKRGVAVHFIKEGIDPATPQGRLMLGIFGSLAEYERAIIRERQGEGIAAARRRGRHLGRPATDADPMEEALAMYADPTSDLSVAQICKACGVSRSALYRKTQNMGMSRRGGEARRGQSHVV